MKLTPACLASTFENITEQTELKLDHKDISHIDDISFCINLRRLDLSNNLLRTAESLSGLQYCKSLVWLNISHNQLDGIGFISKLSNIAVLNLSYNSLKTVPSCIRDLENLKALILNDNQIKFVDQFSFPKSLNTLVISKNLLESLDDGVKGLVHLEKLSASQNKLRAFPKLEHCTVLKELRLNNNQIVFVPSELVKFPASIEILDIGRNLIGSVSDLGAVLQSTHIKSLTVNGCPFANKEVESRELLCRQIPSLELLDNKCINPHPQSRKRKRKIPNAASFKNK